MVPPQDPVDGVSCQAELRFPSAIVTGGKVLGRTPTELKDLARRLFHEFVRFGVVGLFGFVVDVGLFNLLAFGRTTVLHDSPLIAKTVSVTAATAVTWIGNRYFVFRHRRGADTGREALMFVVFSLSGMAIAVGTLWFSHYVLGLTSPLADNISANVIGLGLASAFRFATYRTFVFRHHPAPKVASSISA